MRTQVLSGLATSIGSLPYEDADEAVDVVLAQHPDLPAAPTLPNRSPLESMVSQAAIGIQGVTVRPDGSLDVRAAGLDPAAPLDATFPGEAYGGLLAFLPRIADRHGPVKLQLTGPVTLAMALIEAGAGPDTAFAVSARAVRSRAQALLELVAIHAPAVPMVVFVDEPGLVHVPDPAFPLPPDAVTDMLSGVLAVLEPHATTGVHCCGVTDWTVVIDAGPDMLSAPQDAGLANAPGALATFLERGGVVAWGAVPTHRSVGTLGRILWKRLTDEWRGLVASGCDPHRLVDQAVITPDCGLAGHGASQAERTLRLASRLAERLRDDTLAIRISG